MGTIEKEPSRSKTLAIGFSREEEIATNNANKKLLMKWVIGKRSMKIENLFSQLFAWQKQDGTFGFTFDLKYRRDANSPISVDPPLYSHK